MTADDYTGGEIKRGFDRIEKQLAELAAEVRSRHHTLANQVTAATGPISSLTYRMDNAEKCLDRHDLDLKAVTWKAAFIAGATATVLFVIKIAMEIWKH